MKSSSGFRWGAGGLNRGSRDRGPGWDGLEGGGGWGVGDGDEGGPGTPTCVTQNGAHEVIWRHVSWSGLG